MGRAAGLPAAPLDPISADVSAERRNPLGEPRKFPRGGLLVNDSAGNAAGELGLCHSESFGGVLRLARRNCRLDGLDEGPDAADSRVVDGRPRGVATDTLFGLRRVRHEILVARIKSGAEPSPRRIGV